MEDGCLLAEALEKARDPCERNRPCGVQVNNGLIERVEELAGDPNRVSSISAAGYMDGVTHASHRFAIDSYYST
jgi:hypothetical protein